MAERKKRMSVLQIRRALGTQLEMDRMVLNQMQSALPSLDSVKAVEHARARIAFCRKLLEDTAIHREK